jgi:hypothetical protein
VNHGDRDHDELLRRALHEAVDWLEPSEDGLERIRARLTRPRSAPVAWIIALSQWWARLRAAHRDRYRRWQCAAALLTTAVVVGGAVALALTPLPRQAVARTDALIRSLEGGGPAGGGQGVNGSATRSATGAKATPGTAPLTTHRGRHVAPAKRRGSAPSAAACRHGSASARPDPSPSRAACPSPAASPSPSASASPSPTASPSPSSSPSPSPSVSPSPSASASPGPSPYPGASLGPSASLPRPAP